MGQDGSIPVRAQKVSAFFSELKTEVTSDFVPDVAGMLAYFALFALFPMLIFVVTIALLVVPAEALQEATAMATRALPEQAAAMIQRQLARMQRAAGGGLAVGSAAVALWGASRGSLALGRALNRVFNLRESRPWWRVQLRGIAVTLGVAALLIATLGLLVVGPVAGHWLVDRFGLGPAFDVTWNLGRWIGAALLVMVMWSLLYKFLPDSRAPLRVFTPGAVAGVLLWIGVSLLFGVYVRNFASYEETYGTLGAGMVFLYWLWLSNIAMLTGAEINQVLERIRAPGPGALDPRRERSEGGEKAA